MKLFLTIIIFNIFLFINNNIKNIKDNNLDINDLIKNYDKNSNGIIGNNEFDEFIKSLNIQELKMADITFLKKFLEKDENNNIIYKKFIMIIKD